MTQATFSRLRLYFTAAVMIAIWSLLTWNYFHGGIPRHHLLADKNLPSFSNAWGAIVLPSLAWFLTWRVQKRIYNGKVAGLEVNIRPVIIAFATSLAYATLMALSFTLGHNEIISNMMLAIFAIGLFFPVYRSEYLLGLILGLTVTFGAVLPTIIGSVLCLATAVLYLGVRRGVLYFITGRKAG